ncbi:MAG TPA: beta-galactosidase domain 4-containing protein, partial [Candidatus Limnocylindrales bacterium]
GGDLPLPAIGPGEQAAVAIPGSLPPSSAAGQRILTIRFLLGEATAWAPVAHEMGWSQLVLDPHPTASSSDGWAGDVALDDEGCLLHPSFAASPALSVWRAPTDNDRIGGMAERWAAWGLSALRRSLDTVERAANATTVRVTWTTAAGIAIPHVQRYATGANGRIRVEETVEVPNILGDLPRIGTVLELAPGFEDVEWFGRGPHETYPDRRRGGRLGRWHSTVTNLLTPYVKPQENGGRADVRWIRLGSPSAAVRIDLDEPRQVSALHVRAADLATATHDVEVRPRSETIVHLDAAHRGLGTASCGPDTLPEYVLRPGRYSWAWTVTTEPGAR